MLQGQFFYKFYIMRMLLVINSITVSSVDVL